MDASTTLPLTFAVPVRRGDGPGAWTIAVLPDSGRLLGTRRPVRVSGDIDGQEFSATLLPMGDGSHMVPIKAALRQAIGMADGQQVTVRVTQRLDGKG